MTVTGSILYDLLQCPHRVALDAFGDPAEERDDDLAPLPMTLEEVLPGILNDLLAQQTLLKSYGEQRGLSISSAEAKIIFYYRRRSIKQPFSLIGAELDAHFKFDVVGSVELVNDYFRARLYGLLEQQ